jgi:hypothetical protein
MYARLVSFSGGDAATRDRWVQTIQDTVIPTLRGHEGFAGYIGLAGQDSQEVKGLVFWDSAENAEAAEQTLRERRREVSGGVGLTEQSADLYEVLAMEMDAIRV